MRIRYGYLETKKGRKENLIIEYENDIRGFARRENVEASRFELKNTTLIAHDYVMGNIWIKSRSEEEERVGAGKGGVGRVYTRWCVIEKYRVVA